MSNPWFRMYAEFATDPKVQSMPEVMQRRLVMLFCLKCGDVLVTLQERHIAFALRVTEEELAETKLVYLDRGFIDQDWNLLNWDRRQFTSDSSTNRTRLYRERLRTSQGTSPERHCDGLDTDTDTDTEEKKKNPPPPLAAESPAAPAEAKPPTEFETSVAESAKAIHAQHPALRRDCSPAVIEKCLRAALKRHCAQKSPADKIRFLSGVAAAHAARSRSEQWTRDGGQYAKGLQNYLAPTMDRYLPSGELPAAASGANGKPKRWEDYTPAERAELPGHMNPNLWNDD